MNTAWMAAWMAAWCTQHQVDSFRLARCTDDARLHEPLWIEERGDAQAGLLLPPPDIAELARLLLCCCLLGCSSLAVRVCSEQRCACPAGCLCSRVCGERHCAGAHTAAATASTNRHIVPSCRRHNGCRANAKRGGRLHAKRHRRRPCYRTRTRTRTRIRCSGDSHDGPVKVCADHATLCPCGAGHATMRPCGATHAAGLPLATAWREEGQTTGQAAKIWPKCRHSSDTTQRHRTGERQHTSPQLRPAQLQKGQLPPPLPSNPSPSASP
ncbi:hypothetical protein BC831DRAFT_482306, partial [Entophlyctis helioformis]